MTLVKICGVTNLDDALAAAAAGADLVGLNLWEGTPRRIDPLEADRVVARFSSHSSGAAPDSSPGIVLVDVSPTENRLAEFARRFRPKYLQVHGEWRGGESVEGIPVIRAFALGGEADLAAIEEWPGDLVLLDARVEGLHGGTGKRIEARLLERVKRRYLLAGGLTPGNVRATVEALRPYGVDVASGVEDSPGKKNREAMKRFVSEARAAV